MLILRDLYTQVQTYPVLANNNPIGQIVAQYEVRSYIDTRNLSQSKSYIVNCTQRLVFPSQSPYESTPAQVSNFTNYPGLLQNSATIDDSNAILADWVVLDYSPRTLNSSIESSQSAADNQSVTASRMHTSGSSTSQTNSFGVSGSVGFFGDQATGDVSANYQHSSTSERSQSDSTGNSVETGSQLSNSSSMTIKDWGSYAALDMDNQVPTWTWGQEYPWNIIQFKGLDSNGNAQLPDFVQQRLYDGTIVYPPSELSSFGIDFIARVSWLLTPKAASAGPAEIVIDHTLNYVAASHGLTGTDFVASLDAYDTLNFSSPPLDLPVLALDPLRTPGKSAVIGFVASKFDVAPDAGADPFAITADANNLLVRGSGFNAVMSTDFSAAVQMTVFFKIVDSESTLSLYLKHWIQGTAAVQLAIVLNGNTAQPITRYVDVNETGSGGDNTTTISLRNHDFTSVDYCDYLQMGLNSAAITITRVNTSTPTNYQLVALAVG